MSHPTAAQRRVLDAIREFWTEKGYPPSVRDIAQAIDRSSTTVYYHLDGLQENGWIERDRGVARSIRVREEENARNR